MANNGYPRLCGGTFFVLLLQTIRQRRKARDRFGSGSDGLKETNVLMGLIRVANPDYIDPAQSTFPQNASAYKSCNISDGVYLPFADESFISAFDRRLKNDYQAMFVAMSEFVNLYIDTGRAEKHIRLVKALLELVEKDQSIAGTDLFYANCDGSPMEKTDLCKLNDICLPTFLLGIWHFIVQNRKDNTIGKATFASWHEKPDAKGAKWVYSGHIGEEITRLINVTVEIAVDLTDEFASTVEDDTTTEHDNFSPKQSASEPSEIITNQLINTPAVFINYGTKCTQINNTGILNIDNGGAKS